MQMIALIQAALSPFLLVATCCSPPMKSAPFTLDADISVAEMSALLNDHGWTTMDRLRCRDVCKWVLERRRARHVISPMTCEHSLVAAPEGEPDALAGHVTCAGEAYNYICKGRRPLGHVEAMVVGDDVAAYLARCAHLEAASVIAFAELAGQLRGLGAPETLVAGCVVAAKEEERHAAVLGGLAQAGGARVPEVEVRAGERAVLAIATHNAVEGCVHEAWAAVGAAWMARHAADAGLRAAFVAIAEDEARHAQLAWDVHAWLLGLLDAEERAAVRAAQLAAIAGLPAVAQEERCPAELGMPDAVTLVAMASRFAAGLAMAA